MGVWHLKRFNTQPVFRTTLRNPDGTIYDPTGATALKMHVRTSLGTFTRPLSIIGAGNAEPNVEYAWAAADWYTGLGYSDVELSLLSKLVASYKLDETTGTRQDSFGANPLTPGGSTVGSGAGKVGNAVVFTGSTGRLAAPNATALQVGGISWSLSSWVRLDAKLAADSIIVAKFNVTGNIDKEFLLFYRAFADRFRIEVLDGAVEATVTALASPVVGTWYHLVVTFDQSTKKLSLYTNAVLDGQATLSVGILSGVAEFWIGNANPTANRPLTGAVDATHLFKGVLTAAEIAHLNNSALGQELSLGLPSSGCFRMDYEVQPSAGQRISFPNNAHDWLLITRDVGQG